MYMSESLSWYSGLEDCGHLESQEELPADGVLTSLLEQDIAEIMEPVHETRSCGEDFEDPELFTSSRAGDYTYIQTGWGKSASGVLELCKEPERDTIAQREIGGEDRKPGDDGGHLIGARYGGSPGIENLDAQSRQLNRSTFKAIENRWAHALEDGDQVFVDVETFKTEGSERPAAYMGYSITEHPDGSRDCETFMFPNESEAEQASWGKGEGSVPTQADLDAAKAEAEYTDGIEIGDDDHGS